MVAALAARRTQTSAHISHRTRVLVKAFMAVLMDEFARNSIDKRESTLQHGLQGALTVSPRTCCEEEDDDDQEATFAASCWCSRSLPLRRAPSVSAHIPRQTDRRNSATGSS